MFPMERGGGVAKCFINIFCYLTNNLNKRKEKSSWKLSFPYNFKVTNLHFIGLEKKPLKFNNATCIIKVKGENEDVHGDNINIALASITHIT